MFLLGQKVLEVSLISLFAFLDSFFKTKPLKLEKEKFGLR